MKLSRMMQIGSLFREECLPTRKKNFLGKGNEQIGIHAAELVWRRMPKASVSIRINQEEN